MSAPSATAWLAVAMAVLAVARTTAAQDISDEERRARQLAHEGELAYADGRFDEAAVLIRRAYELYPEPLLLHNLGRALESAGDEGGAVDAYERYLEEVPDAEDRALIEGRLRQLREEIAEEERLRSSVASGASTGSEASAEPVEEGGSVVTGPLVLGGVGLLVVAAGVVSGVLALGKEADADAEPVHQRARELLDDAETLATVTNALLVGGAVIVAVATTWLVIALGSEEEVSLRIGPGSFAVAGHFD